MSVLSCVESDFDFFLGFCSVLHWDGRRYSVERYGAHPIIISTQLSDKCVENDSQVSW